MSNISNDSLTKAIFNDVAEKFTLIEGVFTADEATELLLNLYGTKIQFHENRNFSSMERFGYQMEKDQSRITALKLAREELKKLLNEAVKDGSQLSVVAKIEVRKHENV
jgi:hypothetical protein